MGRISPLPAQLLLYKHSGCSCLVQGLYVALFIAQQAGTYVMLSFLLISMIPAITIEKKAKYEASAYALHHSHPATSDARDCGVYNFLKDRDEEHDY